MKKKGLVIFVLSVLMIGFVSLPVYAQKKQASDQQVQNSLDILQMRLDKIDKEMQDIKKNQEKILEELNKLMVRVWRS